MNPKLMSEFKGIADIMVPHSFNVTARAVGKRLTTVLLEHNGTIIPIGSKFLECRRGKVQEFQLQECQQFVMKASEEKQTSVRELRKKPRTRTSS